MGQITPTAHAAVPKDESVLVGDIGGTNARFAIAEISTHMRLHSALSLRSARYDSLEDAISDYFVRMRLVRPARAVMAVAGPVVDGAVHLTNLSWRVSQAALLEMGFD